MDEIEKQIIDNEIERYTQRVKDKTLIIKEDKECYFKGFKPKTEEEIRKHKAMEEYKQKFLADVEKLKAEKEKGVKDEK